MPFSLWHQSARTIHNFAFLLISSTNSWCENSDKNDRKRKAYVVFRCFRVCEWVCEWVVFVHFAFNSAAFRYYTYCFVWIIIFCFYNFCSHALRLLSPKTLFMPQRRKIYRTHLIMRWQTFFSYNHANPPSRLSLSLPSSRTHSIFFFWLEHLIHYVVLFLSEFFISCSPCTFIGAMNFSSHREKTKKINEREINEHE